MSAPSLAELLWQVAQAMPILLASLVLMGAAGWAFKRSSVAGGLLVAASLAVGLSVLASVAFQFVAPVVIDVLLDLGYGDVVGLYFLATHAVSVLLSAVGWACALTSVFVGRGPAE